MRSMVEGAWALALLPPPPARSAPHLPRMRGRNSSGIGALRQGRVAAFVAVHYVCQGITRRPAEIGR
jgi:hypothetical protein